MRWLTLLMTLPPTPTRHRVGVWRKLQRMGAVRLRAAGWILPDTPETSERFQWLVQEIQGFRGEVALLHVDRVETMADDEIAALFHKARGAEYEAVIEGWREVVSRSWVMACIVTFSLSNISLAAFQVLGPLIAQATELAHRPLSPINWNDQSILVGLA